LIKALCANKVTGLTSEERDIVAEAYDQGAIKVVVGNIYLIESYQLMLITLVSATATMAAGINLPARRVILATPRMGINIIDPAMLYGFPEHHNHIVTNFPYLVNK